MRVLLTHEQLRLPCALLSGYCYYWSLRRNLRVVRRPSAWLARLRRSQSSPRRQQLSHFYVYTFAVLQLYSLATATAYGAYVIQDVHPNERVFAFDDRRVVTRDKFAHYCQSFCGNDKPRRALISGFTTVEFDRVWPRLVGKRGSWAGQRGMNSS